MKLDQCNLDSAQTSTIQEDIDTVHRLAPAHGARVPDVALHVISLAHERPGDAKLPAHQVTAPAAAPPATFQQRCAWEIQRQSFRLVEDDGRVWVIAGAARGALYGADEVLRRLTGVIWSGCMDSDLTFGPTRALPVDVQAPRVPYRGRNGTGPDNVDRAGFFRWMGRNRWNIWRINSRGWGNWSEQHKQSLLEMAHARGIEIGLGDHCIDHFITDEDYEAHPEWMGMRDGQRVARGAITMPEVPHLNAELPIQPCFSNPELAETLTDRMAQQLADNPEIHIFGLWPHDGVNNWCQCEKCVQKAPYEHMHDLAAMLERKTAPHNTIEIIAYSNLLTLPKQPPLAPLERSFALLCPYLRHFQHRVYDPGGPALDLGTRYPEPDRINPVDEREYGELFERWRAHWQQCGTVPGIFEYAGVFYDETFHTTRTRFFYHPPADMIADEIDWYAQRGLQVYYLCGPTRAWPDAYHELSLAAALWGEPDAVDGVAQRYYAALAGAQGPAMQAALHAISQALFEERTPDAEARQLRPLLTQLDNARARQRYELWLEFIEKVRRSCDATAANEPQASIDAENDLQHWLDELPDVVGDTARSAIMRKLSEIHAERMHERATQTAGSRYAL